MPDPLPQAVRMVTKEGLRLAQLDEAGRALALGLVWACLPMPGVWAEGVLNTVLRSLLAGPAAWLDADHVELRRWLVDTGWLARDGYGRGYQRVAAQDLPARHKPLAQALQCVPMPEWITTQRQAHDTRRAARRAAWLAARPDAA